MSSGAAGPRRGSSEASPRPDAGAEPRRGAGKSRSRKLRLSTLIGLLLLAIGLSILGFAAWQYWGTNIMSRREADKVKGQISQEWKKDSGASKGGDDQISTRIGDPIGLIRIPALGNDWEWPVLAGTTDDALRRGVGWYTDTAKPGQVGNFAVAAHRVTHGEPFLNIMNLKKGDKVIVETRHHVYTYELDTDPKELTVQDTDTWVLDPVPGKPTAKPTKSLITLTTCQDLFHSPDRSVAFGHLVSTDDK